MKNLIGLLCILFLFSTLLLAQQESNEPAKMSNLTGNLTLDYYSLENYKPKNENSSVIFKQETTVENRKSPLLAATMSLLVPGAGEFYTGNYWKTAAFVAAEAAAITFAIIYNNKGDNQTDFFQRFADQHWSVKKYAEWTVAHSKEISKDPAFDASKYNVFSQSGNVNWEELNRLERDLGNWYSHTLPTYGKQQYYELIGKYQQFNMGWDDALNDSYTYGKPLSARFLYYSGERGKANDLYAVSSTYVKLLVVNHFLSAIDAAWSATRYNKKLNVSMRMKEVNFAGQTELNPELNIRYNF